MRLAMEELVRLQNQFEDGLGLEKTLTNDEVKDLAQDLIKIKIGIAICERLEILIGQGAVEDREHIADDD